MYTWSCHCHFSKLVQSNINRLINLCFVYFFLLQQCHKRFIYLTFRRWRGSSNHRSNVNLTDLRKHREWQMKNRPREKRVKMALSTWHFLRYVQQPALGFGGINSSLVWFVIFFCLKKYLNSEFDLLTQSISFIHSFIHRSIHPNHSVHFDYSILWRMFLFSILSISPTDAGQVTIQCCSRYNVKL